MFSCFRVQKSCSQEEIDAFYTDVSQWKKDILAEIAQTQLSQVEAYTKACTRLSDKMRAQYPQKRFEDLIQTETERASNLFATKLNSERH